MTDLYNFFNPRCADDHHFKEPEHCHCGSGQFRYAVVDAKGEFDAYVCGECENIKLKQKEN